MLLRVGIVPLTGLGKVPPEPRSTRGGFSPSLCEINLYFPPVLEVVAHGGVDLSTAQIGKSVRELARGPVGLKGCDE